MRRGECAHPDFIYTTLGRRDIRSQRSNAFAFISFWGYIMDFEGREEEFQQTINDVFGDLRGVGFGGRVDMYGVRACLLPGRRDLIWVCVRTGR